MRYCIPRRDYRRWMRQQSYAYRSHFRIPRSKGIQCSESPTLWLHAEENGTRVHYATAVGSFHFRARKDSVKCCSANHTCILRQGCNERPQFPLGASYKTGLSKNSRLSRVQTLQARKEFSLADLCLARKLLLTLNGVVFCNHYCGVIIDDRLRRCAIALFVSSRTTPCWQTE